jgi:hypothetical protein
MTMMMTAMVVVMMRLVFQWSTMKWMYSGAIQPSLHLEIWNMCRFHAGHGSFCIALWGTISSSHIWTWNHSQSYSILIVSANGTLLKVATEKEYPSNYKSSCCAPNLGLFGWQIDHSSSGRWSHDFSPWHLACWHLLSLLSHCLMWFSGAASSPGSGFGGEGGGWMQFATEKRDENLAVLGVFLRKNWSKGSLEARSHGQDSCIQIKPLLLTSKVSYHVARGIAPG